MALRRVSPKTFDFLKLRKIKSVSLLESILPARSNWIQRKSEGISRFQFPKDANVLTDIQSKYGQFGELAKIYSEMNHLVVHKWHHYIPIYETFFEKYRGSPVRLLEIGVSRGGSLKMWREYFGPKAVIFGIDIDPKCSKIEGIDSVIRIGSQDDPNFLNEVIAEMGGLDIVIDDGSHQMHHINASLKHLFSKLSDEGIYFIEDLHTSYWKGFSGGYYSKGNFFRTVDKLINDMHSSYHPFGRKIPEISLGLHGIHIYDSVAVLTKAKIFPPTHSEVG